ncbi:protein kinase [Arcobacter sp. s6]|uniref:protein kinase domain-containing protein n=1 Tax=Arcobacter sp. s6 TaxID=3230363 RepID=UPI0034A09DB8
MNNQLKVSIGQYSTKGRKEINQDFHDVHIPNEPQLTSKGVAIAIADGISSSEVSQEASKISVVSFLEDYFSTSDSWTVKKSAQTVMAATNSWLYSQNRQDKYHLDLNKGYVCTFSAMIIKSTTAHIFHMGDARIYRIRNENIEILTTDHRVWISKEKSYLSRAMGMDTNLNVDYEKIDVEVNDIFLLMTDGIYEYVSNETLIKIVNENIEDLQVAAKMISDLAYVNQSDDNLTIQILKVDNLALKNVDEIQKQVNKRILPPILEARMTFDGYEIIRELSHSSRSHIYLVKDIQSQDLLALKIPSIDLKDDLAYLERFMLEEWIARRINNENVVKSYISTRESDYLYNITEYIQGQTLSQWMTDNPKAKIEIVRDIAQQIAKGLNAFHKLEMIHQDLRPHNIMIDSNNCVKIIDFGATRVEGLIESNINLEQENLQGTALYSAPEYFLQENGTSKSDLFSLGVIVYQMLSGELPYGVQVARCQNKTAQNRLVYKSLYPKFPVWIDETLKKALQVNPNKRYDQISEFIYDLYHPNKKYLNKKKAAIIERNPVIFWQGISFVLFLIILLLIIK